MKPNEDQDSSRQLFGATTVDVAIRLGFIGLLGYWSFRVIAPFLTIGLWSAILVVALYPLFGWLAVRLNARLASALVTFLCLMIVLGPVTWLGLGLVSGTRYVVASLEDGQLTLPVPPDSVRGWPFIGEWVHQMWSLASTNIRAALAEALPLLKPFGSALLSIAQSALYGLFELLVSIIVAGFLFTRSPQLVDALTAFLDRVLSHRGRELVLLAGSTIRNVSQGVIGVAFLQAVLAGAGFVAAGIPAPGVLAFTALLLSIVQIGPTILLVPIVVWSWTTLNLSQATLFTGYMVLVGLMDNILRPLLMARGLATPMPVIIIGAIGGVITYGIIGLFFGPIVLSVAWAVLAAWVQATPPSDRGEKHSVSN